MKNLLKCIGLSIVALIFQACPNPRPITSKIQTAWQCDQVKDNNGSLQTYGKWTFYSSGKLVIEGVEERPNGIWTGTWRVDEQNSMLHIQENTNTYATSLFEDYQVKSITYSTMTLFAGATNGYWQELKFSKYTESSSGGSAGVPKKQQ